MEFYKNIKSFHNFDHIENENYFLPIPPDWVVVISDIKGSTQAIKEGRFKDVNMLGAATITIAINAMKEYNIISVFGGDGATLVIPGSVFDQIQPQFVGLIRIAQERFKLEMRVGAVKVEELVQKGNPIYVGKYQVSTTTTLSQLLGSGVSFAEALIKSGAKEAKLLKSSDPYEWPDLKGLSCRLDKFQSRQGKIASIIVKPIGEEASKWVRRNLIKEIKTILNDDFQKANPITQSALHWRLIPQTLSSEIKFRSRNGWEATLVLLKAIMANVILKFNITAGAFFPQKYKSEVPLQSDFKKFDDNLRMVIDCNEKQLNQIQLLLEKAHRNKFICYGISIADSAVVSCMTFSASQGQHVHFVDGEGCGYTMASIQLKKQMLENDYCFTLSK